jgi:hypothetical protein
MKTFPRSVYLLSFFALASTQCGRGSSTSDVKSHAIPNEENNTVYRVKDGESIHYIYATVNPVSGVKKGYKIECDNVLKLRKLIASTGFPTDLINSTPILAIDSLGYTELKVDEQPSLSCVASDKTYYKSELDGKTKYFFADNKLNRTRLFHLGCQGLADTLGFKEESAFPLPADLIEKLKIYSVSDEDDISCMQGFEIGAKLVWTNGESKTLTLAKTERLPLTTFAALRADGSNAAITLVKEGRCEWVEQTSVGPALLISGNVPVDFQNEMKCTLTFNADAGSPLADTKTLVIKAPPLPVEANGWTRDPLSDNGAGGPLGSAGDGLCNGTEDCVYKDLKGHLWARMDNQYRYHDQALTYCFDLNYGSYSDWRLPTADELSEASAAKIFSLREATKLNLYDYSWAINSSASDPLQANFVSLTNNSILVTSKSTLFRNICIR